MVKEDQWGDLECLHEARQAAITDGAITDYPSWCISGQ